MTTDGAASRMRLKLLTHVVPELISEAFARLPPGTGSPAFSVAVALRRRILADLAADFPGGGGFDDLARAATSLGAESIERRLQASMAQRAATPGAPQGAHDSFETVLDAWCETFRDEVVLPMLMQALGSSMEAAYSTELYILDDHVVRRDFTRLVPTRSAAAFRKAVARVKQGGGGSIGIAGPRGAGKTTTIAEFLRAGPGLGVLVSAPTQYDSREFALHLQASLCRSVLDRTDPGWRRGEHGEPVRARFPGALGRALSWLGQLVLMTVLFALSLIFYVDFGSPRPWEQVLYATGGVDYRFVPAVTLGSYMVARIVEHLLRALVAVGVTVRDVVSAVVSSVASARVDRPSTTDGSLRREAAHLLRQANFLQTHAVGWSGKVSLPLKVEATRTKSFQYAQQPLTYPEIVHSLRGFIERCADRFGAVSIGIDELDKIASAQEAEVFVNQVKGIFGVPGCLFVVSVSEDALAAFERRGISVRDAFDSAFDEVVRIEHLELTETSLMLTHQLPGLPVVFQSLCHCFSGGLPRELVRVARRLADFKDRRVALAGVCHELVSADLRTRMHGIRVAAVRLSDEHDISDLLDELTRLMDWQSAKDLFDTACRLTPAGYTALDRLGWEAAALCYFYASLLEIFTDDLSPREIRHRYESPGSFAALAKIGNALAEHPRAAWLRLDRFRAEHGLAVADGSGRAGG